MNSSKQGLRNRAAARYLGRYTALTILAAVAMLLVSSLQAQDRPVIPLDALRKKGVQGFKQLPPTPNDIMTDRYGLLRSGWAKAVEPGETITFTLVEPENASNAFWTPPQAGGGKVNWIESIEWSLPGGDLSRSSTGAFRLRVPDKPGSHPFKLQLVTTIQQGSNALPGPSPISLEFTLLIKVPYDRNGDGMLNGYPIGIYPNEGARNAPSSVADRQDLYRAPEAFIHVTPEIQNLPISEHFTLGDFCPQADQSKPYYLALDPRLLEFLEAAIDQLKGSLIGADAPKPIKLLAGYLSPNQLSRLKTQGVRLARFNRYQYGDGAAVIWDADGDGRMDDLNRDGQIDQEDAQLLAAHFETVQRKLGKYGGLGSRAAFPFPDAPETPYVGIDMRGYKIKW